jgi:hypothetical protein
VFAPPIELRAGDASTPTVLTFVGPVIDRKELEWWGRGNGAAREVRYWIRPEGSLPADDKSNFNAWVQSWGAAHELNALTSEGGVLLRDPMPTRRSQIHLNNFALRPSCKAMTWAEGRPIGATFSGDNPIGPKTVSRESPAGTGPAPKPPPKTIPKRPGF